MTLDEFDALVRKTELDLGLLQRYGQVLFNTLAQVRPDLAEEIRGSDIDPFYCYEYNTPRVIGAWTLIMDRW